ncbi:hypothetical protein [Loigolactobacillus binensis]|uniref:Uncharacterized protein n=1 Tax=Loigolactobacillus binensis TaxID=2559922 RepID=A0ABW3ED88_9LACO|nr:hypothetical protein [Loigolactobacillus binensis]
MEGPDIIYFPTETNWKQTSNAPANSVREEVIFLLERIDWTRDLKIVELDIPLVILDKGSLFFEQGSFEQTQGGIQVSADGLFEPEVHLQMNKFEKYY